MQVCIHREYASRVTNRIYMLMLRAPTRRASLLGRDSGNRTIVRRPRPWQIDINTFYFPVNWHGDKMLDGWVTRRGHFNAVFSAHSNNGSEMVVICLEIPKKIWKNDGKLYVEVKRGLQSKSRVSMATQVEQEFPRACYVNGD